MFLGSIEVICGPMFSGKTEELIRRVRLAQIARQRVQMFKPAMDDRFHKEDIVSRSNFTLKASPLEGAREILASLNDSTRVVGIDEVQFFDEAIIGVSAKLAKRGIRVICSGLDQNFSGETFPTMSKLLAMADYVDKIQAVCTICGAPASKTFCSLRDPSDRVVIGDREFFKQVEDTELFEARCNPHYYDS